MITWLAAVSFILALIPALLFLHNLVLYAPLPPVPEPAAKPDSGGADGPLPKCSVLIPARNEETNIAAAVESVLAGRGIDLELIVLDDGSTDRTPEIVRKKAESDRRVRLETAAPLPAGWCGKNFACYQLAALASHPVLIFMDADVRVSRPDSLARLAGFMDSSGAALVSGVPKEDTVTLMEQLIIPLIHFVLLGFLPLRRMRSRTDPRFSAACGQILAVRRDDYLTTGGHTAVASRIHDAVALTRHFRSQNLKTDLFDATDTFRCRMYHTAAEVWSGFAKNAHEGLGSRAVIVPATLLLLGGQVLPLCLLMAASTPLAVTFAALGSLAVYLPRLLAVSRFRQPIPGALLHPAGIVILIAIQRSAFFRSLRGHSATWKGRKYSAGPTK